MRNYDFQDEPDHDAEERDEMLRDEAADEKQVRELEKKLESKVDESLKAIINS